MFEWLFGYPRTLFQESSWQFQSNWPLSWYWLTLLLAAICICFTLYRSRKNLHPLKLLVIGALQMAIIASALLLLWRPALQSERLIANENSLALLLDTSTSMVNQNAGTTRIEAAQSILESDPIESLQDTFKVRRLTFADSLNRAESFDDIPDPGTRTEIGTALVGALQQASTESLAAIVLVSDGAQSDGAISAEQLDQITAFGVPVHTVGVGRESINEDLELASLSMPERVLPNTKVTAEIIVRHDIAGAARIKVYQDSEFLLTQEIELTNEGPLTSTSIELDIGDTGLKQLEFRLDPLEGEQNLLNNLQSRVLRVEERQYRVLYLEGEPRWEYKFIRRALDPDPTLDLNTLLWLSDSKFYRQGIKDPTQLASGFPTDTEALYAYDTVIIGSLEAPRLTTEQQQMLHDFVSERGGSLLMLGGRNGLGEGGWGNSLLASALPAKLTDTNIAFNRTRLQAQLTAEGHSSTLLQLKPEQQANDEHWAALPELADYQEVGELRPAANTLLSIDTGATGDAPLLISQPYGRGKSVILATGGTWRWQMQLPATDESHETFWRQLLRALVASSGDRFSFTAEPRDGEIQLRAEVRDEQFQAVNDVRITVLASNESGDAIASEPIELSAVSGKPGVYQAQYQPEGTGTWFFDAVASRDEQPLASGSAAIHRSGDISEYFNIRKNRQQLERLAIATGGRYWETGTLEALPDVLGSSTTGITEKIVHPLWYVPLVFLWLLLLKIIEWSLRRYWGQI